MPYATRLGQKGLTANGRAAMVRPAQLALGPQRKGNATMYTPTNASPAAMPAAASYMRPALYHYAPAPYMRRRNGPARSLAAALAARGTGPKAARAYMARQFARALAGLPVIYPPAR